MPIKIILLSLKKISLKEENFFLLRIQIEEKTKSKPTKSLKSKKYLNLRAKTKKIIKNGKQNKLYSFIKLAKLYLPVFFLEIYFYIIFELIF